LDKKGIGPFWEYLDGRHAKLTNEGETTMKNTEDRLIGANEVRARLGGISDMTLWRWIDDQAVQFPKPVYVRRRRFWNDRELQAWIERQPIAVPAPQEKQSLPVLVLDAHHRTDEARPDAYMTAREVADLYNHRLGTDISHRAVHHWANEWPGDFPKTHRVFKRDEIEAWLSGRRLISGTEGPGQTVVVKSAWGAVDGPVPPDAEFH
jgi:predicted DNA-binding transcriptional regulator AlpA